MKVSCRKCRETINGPWIRHEECMVLLKEEVPQETEINGEVQGRITCKRCKYSLGRFKWQGSKCSCGKWIFPYISIHISSVDISH
ncbi:hypothetical protein NEFER03_1666 [Nematocida sp. LUAm3]|nr:hypothetical protein NEFER03_1666 [Nematocida sp. LUAm3]KAI5175615.1 hypothetical protein NEFER02_1502 [Nematocida sp. LUAm2]KAI5178521.1 hypothetical protein NEFER01_1657 [Nematocida sp. LUAm1]